MNIQDFMYIIVDIKYFSLQNCRLTTVYLYHAIYVYNLYFRFDWLSIVSASSENIQMQAIPPTVTLRESDLVVLCSITNPSQLASLFFIQLSRNASVNFSTVVSVVSEDKILWADSTLHNRGATATGSISTLNTAQLRLTLKKDIVRCPDDFKMYKCKMAGLDVQSNVVEDETLPITVTYNSMYCIQYAY